MATGTAPVPRFGIVFARSSASTSSTPELVKAYAVDFCGTKTLREASREQVENFVQQLADWAEKDRNALVCQLNSYSRPKQEVVA
jgi:hypothetical protein